MHGAVSYKLTQAYESKLKYRYRHWEWQRRCVSYRTNNL